jgi:hypothetical protein
MFQHCGASRVGEDQSRSGAISQVSLVPVAGPYEEIIARDTP